MFQSPDSTFEFSPIKKISTFQIKIFNFGRKKNVLVKNVSKVLMFDRPERFWVHLWTWDVKTEDDGIMERLPLCDLTVS